MTLEAWNAYERLGSPEGELALAQAVVFLACAAKSNAVYRAFTAAQRGCERARLPRGAAAYAQCADAAHARISGMARAIATPTTSRTRFAAGERYLPDELPRAELLPARRGAAWRRASARSWPICASATGRLVVRRKATPPA